MKLFERIGGRLHPMPEVLSLLPDLESMVIARVSRREADMGLVYAPVVDPALESEDLITSETACVVPSGRAWQ